MDTKLGIGLASGMFFHATVGTALPTYPTQYVGDNGDGTNTETFTATAGQTTFTLAEEANAISSLTVNGTEADSDDYSVSGTTLTWAGTTLSEDDAVIVIYYVSAWRLVGDISNEGITLTTDKSVTNIYNWANVTKRAILTEHTETIQAPVMDTTEDTMKTVLGEDNVTVTDATSTHGKTIACNLSAGSLPDEEAYLFIMKDGDDLMAIGMSDGQITAVESVTFAPESAIIWKPTITALGDGVVFISEEG